MSNLQVGDKLVIVCHETLSHLSSVLSVGNEVIITGLIHKFEDGSVIFETDVGFSVRDKGGIIEVPGLPVILERVVQEKLTRTQLTRIANEQAEAFDIMATNLKKLEDTIESLTTKESLTIPSGLAVGDKFEIMDNHSGNSKLSKGVVVTLSSVNTDSGNVMFEGLVFGTIDGNKVYVGGCTLPLKPLSNSELTGSDLCRAMLEKGMTDIDCYVDDECDEDAISDKFIRKITKIREDGRFSQKVDCGWQYAVPVGRKILTAKDVGL